jgi:hypothetical protein
MGPALLDALARPVEMFVDDSNRDAYFSHVAGDAIRVRKLFVGGEDPLEKMRRTWRDAGWTEVPAAEDGDRRYHPDAVWGLREAAASPHVDAYECYRQLALSRFKRHLNYNVYLQDAQSGGAFAVYNRYAADPRSEGGAFVAVLDPAALTDNQRIEHRPAPGDLVIFDALLYHEVTPVDGRERARIQEHSNVLVDPATREVLFFA